MKKELAEENKRILVIDDDPAICNVYKRVLSPKRRPANSSLSQMAQLLYPEREENRMPAFSVDAAFQGKNGFDMVTASIEKRTPYAVAFIDIRMPPGWDGMETARRIREIDPDIEIVIVTAYSDRSGHEIVRAVGSPEKLLFLRKPFDAEEIFQLALSLTEKWNIARKEQRAKADLIRSESRFRALMETTRDFVWETDASGIFTYCSPICEAMYGYPADALLGQSILHVLKTTGPCNELSRFFSANGNKNASFVNIERCIERKDGGTVHVDTSGVKVFTPDGIVANIRGIDRDISQRKKSEEERSRLEDQYRQSQKMEAIGTLAGGIAHDFNNILSVIMGYTQLAINTLPSASPAKLFLEKAMTANNRAAELTHQILSFSRQTEKEMKPIDMGDTVREILDMLRASLPSTIRIVQDIDVDPGKDVIRADTTQINQLMMNLCTNAAQAMGTDGGQVTVSLRHMEIDAFRSTDFPDIPPGRYLRLSVSDTGQGMETNVMEKIFEPFYSTKQVGEGTGLGLSVVHGIVQNHGGVIKVDSVTGKGSTFTIFFPKLRDEELLDEGKMPKFLDIPTGTEHVLFVDDEQDLVDIGKELIGSLGYTVSATCESLEALEIFSSKPDDIDVVVTDMTMPDMTGALLAKRILDIRPNMPIILCSGFSEASIFKSSRAEGIKELLRKPFSLTDMAKTIRKVLDAR